MHKAEEYWHSLGPGLTTGAADDDPSGIATYSEVGAKYGFQMLWLATLTFPLMAVVQEMCARIGLVTGQGLAGNIKDLYPRWVLHLCTALLFIANVFNIGADLGAMAAAAQLLSAHVPFEGYVIFFAVLGLVLQIFTSYKTYAQYLKWLALVLLAYVVTAFFVDIDVKAVARAAVIPTITFSREQLLLITAVLGTTISPYLFFWQTSQEVEEKILAGRDTIETRRGSNPVEIKKMRIDVWSGMFLSNVIMFFIIVVCGATLFSQDITITTAADAAAALEPLAGRWATLLFAIGIIGTGFLAVPVLAGSASYALAESFDWKEGLYRKFNDAYGFYAVIILSVLVGLAINFLQLDPIRMLVYSAVVNGLVAPLILGLIVHISSQRAVMGEWANGRVVRFLGWFLTVGMTIAGIATIFSLVA